MICNFTNSSTSGDKNVFQAIKLATNLDKTVPKENREATLRCGIQLAVDVSKITSNSKRLNCYSSLLQEKNFSQ